jgi:hypothetical protein
VFVAQSGSMVRIITPPPVSQAPMPRATEALICSPRLCQLARVASAAAAASARRAAQDSLVLRHGPPPGRRDESQPFGASQQRHVVLDRLLQRSVGGEADEDAVEAVSVAGSTQAGMIAGFAGQARERRVVGIDGSAKPAETRAQIARIAHRTSELIGVGRDLREHEIILDDRYHAGTYGTPDETTLEAIRLAGRLEGMITDPSTRGSRWRD